MFLHLFWNFVYEIFRKNSAVMKLFGDEILERSNISKIVWNIF